MILAFVDKAVVSLPPALRSIADRNAVATPLQERGGDTTTTELE